MQVQSFHPATYIGKLLNVNSKPTINTANEFTGKDIVQIRQVSNENSIYPTNKLFTDCNSYIKETLPSSTYQHTKGVVNTAIKLARMFNVDPNKAALAALLHDNSKWMTSKDMIKFAQQNNIKPAGQGKLRSKVLHGPVSAFIAKTKFGINSPDILEAITYHSCGKPKMSDLAKIVLLADKIEPVTRDKNLIKDVMNTLTQTKSLDEGLITLYQSIIQDSITAKEKINIDIVNLWNSLTTE